MIAGQETWGIDIVGAAEDTNTVWGFSSFGILSQDERWYWVDSIAPQVRALGPAYGSEVAPPRVGLKWTVSEAAECKVFTNGAQAGRGQDGLVLSNVNVGVYHWFVKAQDGAGNVG